jgi:hypothetical protein
MNDDADVTAAPSTPYNARARAVSLAIGRTSREDLRRRNGLVLHRLYGSHEAHRQILLASVSLSVMVIALNASERIRRAAVLADLAALSRATA